MPRMCFRFARPRAMPWPLGSNACPQPYQQPVWSIEACPDLVLACGIRKRRARRSTVVSSPSSLAGDVPLPQILVTLLLSEIRVALLRTAFASNV